MIRSRIARHLMPGLACAVVVLNASLGPATSASSTKGDVVDQIIGAYRTVSVPSPDAGYIAIEHHNFLPGLAELPDTVLNLAGWRIDPAAGNNIGPLNSDIFKDTSVWDVKAGRMLVLPPVPSHLGIPLWSPDGRRFGVMRAVGEDVQLWIVDVANKTVRQMPNIRLNAARATALPEEGLNLPCSWTRDSKSLLCLLRPSNLKRPADTSSLAATRRETGGAEKGITFLPASKIYLQSQGDIALYDYYLSSQPAFVDATSGALRAVGPVSVYADLRLSPNEQYILAARIVKPYSFETTDRRFPSVTEIWDRQGRILREIARSGLDTSGDPQGGAARTAPRQFFWQPTAPDSLCFYQALDTNGYHDSLRAMGAPFQASTELFRSHGRMGQYPVRSLWLKDGSSVIVEEFDRASTSRSDWFVPLGVNAGVAIKLRTESFHNSSDFYDNGEYLTEIGAHTGREASVESWTQDAVLAQSGDWLYLRAESGTAGGAPPFLDRLNLKTQQRERLFTSPKKRYVQTVSLLDRSADRLLISDQDRFTPPNLKILDRRSGSEFAITHVADPYPQLTHARIEVVTYKRADGLPLEGELFYPTDYKPGDKPPVVIWGYPQIRETAGSTFPSHDTSDAKFPDIRIIDGFPLPLITHGYAIFNADMPLTGGAPHANDTNNEQLAADAKAAVDLLVQKGVADRAHIGIGGHSYGAFMAASLMVNTDLFAAGVGMSGLYNVSLVPAGFQDETRSYWQAKEVYEKISPFVHADKISGPFLMIHGDHDESPAQPIQSQNFYQALEALGKKAALIVFPRETHNYRARDTLRKIEDEELTWFDRYVKTPKAVNAAEASH